MSAVPEPVVYPMPHVRRVNVKKILFNVFVMPVLGFLYWQVNSIGWRLTFGLAGKLHKFPLFAWMRNYKGWCDFDVANVAAMGQFLLVWASLTQLMPMLIYERIPGNPVNPKFVRTFVLTAGIILLVWDSAMTYLGIADQAWGNHSVLRSAIATVDKMVGPVARVERGLS